jgi:hypothetical protein
MPDSSPFRGQIGDAGLSALADACNRGAMANLKELYFDRGNISGPVKSAIKDICKERGISGSPDYL